MDKSTVLAWLTAVLPDGGAAPAVAVAPDPIYNTTTGWAFNTMSPIGGVSSMRLDQAIADIAAQNSQLAAHIPRKVMGRFWLPPDPSKNIAMTDPQRLAGPTPEQQSAMNATNAQIHSIISNLERQQNFNLALFMGSNDPDHATAGYRGEPNAEGFPLYVPTEQLVWTVLGKQTVTRTPTEAGLGSHPVPLAHTGGTPDTLASDTGLYDPWFDLQTDINIARFWRKWAISYGVAIALEPTL